MTWMKTIGKWISLVLVGLSVSVFSMFIQVGADDSARETIGIRKKWGFPVAYRTTAPGLARADYNVIRFWENTFLWLIGLAFFAVGISRMKRGSNQASHPTLKPAPGAGFSSREG
jgi:hypothetical protein